MSSSQPVLILGMHRSGTSSLAGSLEQHGLYLANVFKWNPHNQKGNRENPEIMGLNESVISYNQGSWDNPPLAIKWNDALAKQRDDILNDFYASQKPVWGFKDPRTLITLEFWLDNLPSPQFVGTFRNPLAVAASLAARNKFSLENSLNLWQSYNQKLLYVQKKFAFPLVNFDASLEDYNQRVRSIAKSFNLNSIPTEVFREDHLKHHLAVDSVNTLPPPILDLYLELQHIYSVQWKHYRDSVSL